MHISVFLTSIIMYPLNLHKTSIVYNHIRQSVSNVEQGMYCPHGEIM